VRPPDLEKLRESGRISATVREHGKTLIQPGRRIADIAGELEQMILDLGGMPAFPVQLSRNHIAAHACHPPGHPEEIEANDIVKLDLGTQVDGYVTDNAVTVDLQAGPNSALVAASRTALDNAIELMGPGASLADIGARIEQTIKAFGFTPVYNLTGHGVARYVIHCAPSVPNYHDRKAVHLKPNQTIACEPFACDGRGAVDEHGEAEVFMLARKLRQKDNLPPEVEEAVMWTQGLPFARRSLRRFLDEKQTEKAIELLRKKKLLREYPPLVEKPGVRVAQTEHTIFIHEDRAEVLTLAPKTANA
jgi:methionyl aminopeptidase